LKKLEPPQAAQDSRPVSADSPKIAQPDEAKVKEALDDTTGPWLVLKACLRNNVNLLPAIIRGIDASEEASCQMKCSLPNPIGSSNNFSIYKFRWR